MTSEGSSPRRTEGAAPGQSEDASSVAEHYQQDKMARELGWYASFSVAFGFVSIATGIFTAYGAVLNTSGPRGIWAWPITVVGQLAVALIFGALAARIPISGYAYQWVSRIANPVAGWIMGWISFAFLGVVVVAVDYTIAATILPELIGYTGTLQNAWAITAVVILIQAIMVAWSTRATNKVNEVAVTIQIIGMLGLTALLFIVGAVQRPAGLFHPVRHHAGAVGELLELRGPDPRRPVPAGVPARRVHHRRLRVGRQPGRGDQEPGPGHPQGDGAGRPRRWVFWACCS